MSIVDIYRRYLAASYGHEHYLVFGLEIQKPISWKRPLENQEYPSPCKGSELHRQD